MKRILTLLLLNFILTGCNNADKKVGNHNNVRGEIICDDNGCRGTYIGKEFINILDVAHQFSNKMCDYVGDKLKELYAKGIFSKVDFDNIYMSTEGMGLGEVIYKLSIPFIRVQNRCESYTSFDHVGGWNHSPALTERKIQLSKALIQGEELYISDLKTTNEGLQEYWIQWKNNIVQVDCSLNAANKL